MRGRDLWAPLIYSMSVSADGFIEGLYGDFSWTMPGKELFRFRVKAAAVE
jgi:hypothetical protein